MHPDLEPDHHGKVVEWPKYVALAAVVMSSIGTITAAKHTKFMATRVDKNFVELQESVSLQPK